MPVRDSLSKCDVNAYSNIYTVRSHPEVKADQVNKNSSIPKDTLEEIRGQLKQDALERLRHTSKFSLFQSGAGRIGKYIFLTVAMPPYLVLYELPKWILVEAIPFIFSICANFTAKINEKVQERFQAVKHYTHLLIQKIQQMTQKAIQPIIHFVAAMQQAIHHLQQRTRAFLKKTRENILKPFKRLRGEASILKRAQKPFVQAGQWVSHQATVIREKMQAAILWIKYKPREGFEKGVRYIKDVALPAFENKIGRHLQASMQWASKIVDKAFAPLFLSSQGFSWLKEEFQQTYIKWAQPVVIKVKDYIKKHWQRFSRFFSGKFQGLIAYCEKMKARCLFLSQSLALKQRFSKSSKWIRTLWEKVGYPIVQKALIVSAYGFSAMAIVLKYVEQAYRFVSQWVKVAYAKAKSLFTQVSSLIMHYLMMGLAYMGFGIRKSLYWLLIGIIMTAILAVWGMQLVGETSAQLMSRWALQTKR